MCNKVEDAKAFYDNVSAGDDVYLSDDEYIDLLMNKKALKRVRELADRLESKEAFHQLTAYACAEEIRKALNGEHNE